MSYTFSEYIKAGYINIESVSLPDCYSNYLEWLKYNHVRITASEILFQIKIINDLVIYNLSQAEKSKAKQQEILNQQDPTLSESLRNRFAQVFPSPDQPQIAKNYFRARLASFLLGLAGFCVYVFTPSFVMGPLFTLALGLMLTPLAAMFAGLYKHIDVKHFDKPTRWFTATALLGLGGMIALDYTQIIPSLVGGINLSTLVNFPIFLVTVVSIAVLTASFIRDPLHRQMQELTRQEPELSDELTNLISPDIRNQAPELREAVSATTSCFLSSSYRDHLWEDQTVPAHVILDDYQKIRNRPKNA
jgi:hypothetical protein